MAHPNGGRKFVGRKNSFQHVFNMLMQYGGGSEYSTGGDYFEVTAERNHHFPKLKLYADIIEYTTSGEHIVRVCAKCWEYKETCDGNKEGTRHEHYSRILDEACPPEKKRA